MLILGLKGLMGSLKKSVKVGNKRSTFVVETVQFPKQSNSIILIITLIRIC